MISITTASAIEGYLVIGAKGTAQGATFDDMLRHAETLGANAIVKADYDNALGGAPVFHGVALLIEPIPILPTHLRGKGGTVFGAPSDHHGNGVCK